MEVLVLEIHTNLRQVVSHQTHYRLREAMGRKRAELLNEGVFLWSLICFVSILVVSICQIFILKQFFSQANVDGKRLRTLPTGVC